MDLPYVVLTASSAAVAGESIASSKKELLRRMLPQLMQQQQQLVLRLLLLPLPWQMRQMYTAYTRTVQHRTAASGGGQSCVERLFRGTVDHFTPNRRLTSSCPFLARRTLRLILPCIYAAAAAVAATVVVTAAAARVAAVEAAVTLQYLHPQRHLRRSNDAAATRTPLVRCHLTSAAVVAERPSWLLN